MSKVGLKHLIKCVCLLPQLSKLNNAPSHEFPVFSIYDDVTNDFEATFVKCNNCGVVHKVTDLCMSTIIKGRDELNAVISIDDVRSAMPEKLATVLDHHHADLPTWQQVAWIVESQSWGSSTLLTSEYIDGTRQGKSLIILGESLYKISMFSNETVAKGI